MNRPWLSKVDIEIKPVPKGVTEKLKERDANMAFKCTGGMFDCDGDRRDYAKQQYKEWLERGGKGSRGIGKYPAEKS